MDLPRAGLSAYRQWYEHWYAASERACAALGHPYGFNPPLLNSVESLTVEPRLLVATLNPAGNVDYPDHRGLYRYEGQNAYVDIDWIGHGVGQAPLQRQIQEVFEHLRRRTHPISIDAIAFARSNVVTTQLVPFRSPSEKLLHRREDSVRFSREMWSDLFSHWSPTAVVAVGSTTGAELTAILGQVKRDRYMPTGWGEYRLLTRQFARGTRLLVLPHLSRFALFGRPQSEPYLNEAFDWLTEREVGYRGTSQR